MRRSIGIPERYEGWISPSNGIDLVRAYRVGRLYARILRRVERPGAYERIALTAVLTGVGGTNRSNAAACA